MPRTGNYTAYVETPYLFARSLEDQYDMTYNNFKEKVNYETPFFVIYSTRCGQDG